MGNVSLKVKKTTSTNVWHKFIGLTALLFSIVNSGLLFDTGVVIAVAVISKERFRGIFDGYSQRHSGCVPFHCLLTHARNSDPRSLYPRWQYTRAIAPPWLT